MARKGSQLGPYIIGETLGKGAYGKVKLATHIDTGDKYAIKIMEKRLLGRSAARRTKREMKILQLLDHPNIARLKECLEDDENVLIMMEYVDGGELFNYLVARRRLKEPEARKLFTQMLFAVEYCHSKGVVHRDLKPENVLIDSQGNCKLIDFGLSNILVADAMLKTRCGSPHYTAPEVMAGQGYGPQADVFSLGVILFALLAGRLPWPFTDDARVREAIDKEDYTIPPSIPHKAADLIRRMLDVNPDHRLSIYDVKAHVWMNLAVPDTAKKLRERSGSFSLSPRRGLGHALETMPNPFRKRRGRAMSAVAAKDEEIDDAAAAVAAVQIEDANAAKQHVHVQEEVQVQDTRHQAESERSAKWRNSNWSSLPSLNSTTRGSAGSTTSNDSQSPKDRNSLSPTRPPIFSSRRDSGSTSAISSQNTPDRPHPPHPHPYAHHIGNRHMTSAPGSPSRASPSVATAVPIPISPTTGRKSRPLRIRPPSQTSLDQLNPVPFSAPAAESIAQFNAFGGRKMPIDHGFAVDSADSSPQMQVASPEQREVGFMLGNNDIDSTPTSPMLSPPRHTSVFSFRHGGTRSPQTVSTSALNPHQRKIQNNVNIGERTGMSGTGTGLSLAGTSCSALPPVAPRPAGTVSPAVATSRGSSSTSTSPSIRRRLES